MIVRRTYGNQRSRMYVQGKLIRPAVTNRKIKKISTITAKRVVRRSQETKQYDLNFAPTNFDYTTGYVQNITNGIARGAAQNQYVGDSVTPYFLDIAGSVALNGAIYNNIQLLLIQNKAGGVPIAATIWQSVVNSRAPFSQLDVDYDHTYTVKYKRILTVDTYHPVVRFRIRIPAHKLSKIWYNDAAGTLEKGGIYFCAISDASVNLPNIQYQCRFAYKDA